ncbi:Transcriptional repressor NrdR [compost metagenome]
MAVIKKDGSRELFDREKLATAIKRSVGKFFSSEIEVEEIIDNVENALYELGESEIFSRQIGDKVLDELAVRNEVAYVRFASVYHEFKTLDEFEAILAQRRKK